MQQKLDIDEPTATCVKVGGTTVGWIVSEHHGASSYRYLVAYDANGRRITGCGNCKGTAIRHVLQSIRPDLTTEPMPAAIARQVIGSEATQ